MPRDLKGNPVGPTPKDVVHLIRLKYWDGAAEQEIRLTDASSDLEIDVGNGDETWTGAGLLLTIGEVEESADLDAPGLDIALDGVDQTIISIIMDNQFRSREAKVWRVWLDPDTGDETGTGPVLMFDGYQSENYSIQERFTEEADTVSVSTRLVGRISSIERNRPVKTNTVSHNEMLESAGVATGDTFFQNVPGLEGQEVYWGRDEPETSSTGTHGPFNPAPLQPPDWGDM